MTTTSDAIVRGLGGRCPRCGEGRMFGGFLSLADRCQVCDLDFDFADSADGPAVFVMMIVGFIVVGLVLAIEVAYTPPMWVHVAYSLPLLIALSLAMLRPFKGVLIALQFHHKAEEGRLVDREDR